MENNASSVSNYLSCDYLLSFRGIMLLLSLILHSSLYVMLNVCLISYSVPSLSRFLTLYLHKACPISLVQIVNWRTHLKLPEEARLSLEAKDLIGKLLCSVNQRLGSKGAGEIKVLYCVSLSMFFSWFSEFAMKGIICWYL